MKSMDKLSKLSHWFLRLAISSVFLYHGIGKFPQLSQMASMIKMPVFVVLLVALMEVVGALLVLLGGFLKSWVTRLGALLIVPVMIGAIFMMHWGQWSFLPTQTHPTGGIEFQVVLLLVLLYISINGNKINTV